MQIDKPQLERLITYSMLMTNAYLKNQPMPLGWVRISRKFFLASAQQVVLFYHPETDAHAFCWHGQKPWWPQSMLQSVLRQKFDIPYPEIFKEWIDEQVKDHMIQRFVVIGHSGGAGIAQYMGWLYATPAFCFEGGAAAQHTFDARLNTGRFGLTSVWIKGSKWGDGDQGKGVPPGEVIRLDPIPGKWEHNPITITKALEKLL